MSYFSANWYIEIIEHRLGVTDAGSFALTALQLACGELNAHPWLWASERPITLTPIADEARITLPANVERVTSLLINGYPADQVAPSLLQSVAHSHGIAAVYAMIGSDDETAGFGYTIQLSAPAVGDEEIQASVAFTVPEPVSSESVVMVPGFLRLALVELSCAVAEGLTFPEEGTVGQRTGAVWGGTTMRIAKTRDGMAMDGPQPQTGAGAIASTTAYDGVHSGMPRSRGWS